MPQIFKNKQLIIVILATVFLLFLIAYTSSGTETTGVFGDWLGRILTPVQDFVYKASGSIYDFFTGFQTKRQLTEQNEELKKQLEELSEADIRAKQLAQENERLRALLQFKDNNQAYTVTAARVIGKNPGNWFNVIAINKGTNDGVDVDMAVVTSDGLVGRVIEANADFSKVITIVDNRSSVAGIIERTRDNGVVRGNNFLDSEDGLCKMIYLPVDSDIIEGDIVTTSGIGGIIPKGIVIGEVIEVIKEQDDLMKYAIIKPKVDFLRIEEVLVIKSQVPKIDELE